MSIADWCQAIQASQIGTSIRESALVFPLIETAHVIGLALSVGIIIMLDLRLVGAGLLQASPRQVMTQLKPWYLTGFAGMFLSGALLFWSEAFSCYQSPSFRWKIAFLCLAGLNAAVFEVVYRPGMDAWGPSASSIPVGARLAGWCSLVCVTGSNQNSSQIVMSCLALGWVSPALRSQNVTSNDPIPQR